jgi:hypothetical protein
MNKFLKLVMSLTMMCFITTMHAQAPVLGATANFAVFSTNGAVTNTGLSLITGDVGTNNGGLTGFGNIDGVMHNGDGATNAAAVSLTLLYNQLNSAIPTNFPAALLGNGQTLNPGVHFIPQAATLNGVLTLDGGGDPNAQFIFQIQGALSSGAAAEVILTNGTQACNVFWKVEPTGVNLATNTIMKGTIVANNAAIILNTGVKLEGRALSTTGAVSLAGATVTKPIGCGSVVLTGPVAPALNTVSCFALFTGTGSVTNAGISMVTGDIGTNSGLVTGFQAANVNGTIHPGPNTVTALTAAELGVVKTYLAALPTDIPLLYPADFGNGLVLTPHTYHLNAATVLNGTVYLNAQGNANAVFVIKINGALSTSTYAEVILQNGAQAKNVYWVVSGGAISLNDYTNFKGTLIGDAAVNLNTGVTVAGSVLTTGGAFDTASVNVQMTPGCTSLGTNDTAVVTQEAKLYPNPFSTVLNVTVEGVDNGSNLKLYDASGSKVLDVRLSNKTTSLPINLPAGVYFYQLTGKNGEQQGGKLISKP